MYTLTQAEKEQAFRGATEQQTKEIQRLNNRLDEHAAKQICLNGKLEEKTAVIAEKDRQLSEFNNFKNQANNIVEQTIQTICQHEGFSVPVQPSIENKLNAIHQYINSFIFKKQSDLKVSQEKKGNSEKTLEKIQNLITKQKSENENCVSRLSKLELVIQASINEIKNNQSQMEQRLTKLLAENEKAKKQTEFKRTENDKRRSEVLLNQEHTIVQLKEQLQKNQKISSDIQSANKNEILDLARKLQESENKIQLLQADIQTRDVKIIQLQEKEKLVNNTVDNLYEIKAELVTTTEEFKNLKIQLHKMSEEKKMLISELSEVSNQYEEKIKEIKAANEYSLAVKCFNLNNVGKRKYSTK